jgi:hypothetical protein
MTLLDVFNALQNREINLSEAAKALGMTDRDLKFRLTRHGARLPGILTVLDRIRRDEITRDNAATYLNVSVREVNQLMKTWRVSRPLKQYLVDRAAAKVKWEVRKKFAIEFIAAQSTIEDAAENAGVSQRQMRRWVSDLLDKHYGMVFKDLRRLTEVRRRRLADEIETAEGLELAKQQMVKAIADGKRSITDEALDRVLARKARRKQNV